MSISVPTTTQVGEPLRGWLQRAIADGASDLHLVPGYPPVLRWHGDLTELPEPPLTGADMDALLRPLCPPDALAHFDADKSVDFSLDLPLDGRERRFIRSASIGRPRRAGARPSPTGRRLTSST